jgi:GNAT superfamily N-acetyltransferase
VTKSSPEIESLTQVDPELAARLDELFDEGTRWDDDQGRRFLASPDNLFLAARWEGEICGFLTAHRLQRVDRRRAEVLLYEIGVAAPFRWRGIGRALIEQCKIWAADLGADEVWVLTEASNAAAMAMYTATGGVMDGVETRMFTYKLEA